MAHKETHPKLINVKSITEQIAEHEKAILELKAELARGQFQEFPKYIADPTDSAKGRTVENAEQEKLVRASYVKLEAAAKKQAELKKKIAVLQSEYDQTAEVEAGKPTVASDVSAPAVKPAKVVKAKPIKARKRRAA